MASIKNLYTGAATLLSGSTGDGYDYIDVTLPSAVSDQDVSEINMTYRVENNVDDPNDININIGFNGTSKSEIRIERNSVSHNTEVYIEWQVIEYDSGVTVQHGTSTGTTSEDITISSVTLSQSWSRVSWLNVGSDYGYDDYMYSWLTSTTNLHLESGSGQVSPERRWQVVDYDNCDVQQVSGTLAYSDTQSNETITSVDLTKTLLRAECIGDYNPDDFNGIPNYLLTSATNARVIRQDDNQAPQYYYIYVIEFSDDVSVQRGSETFSAGQENKGLTISTVNTDLTIVEGGGNHRGAFHRNDDTVTEANRVFFTLEIEDSTTLRARREDPDVAAYLEWQVMEYSIATINSGRVFQRGFRRGFGEGFN